MPNFARSDWQNNIVLKRLHQFEVVILASLALLLVGLAGLQIAARAAPGEIAVGKAQAGDRALRNIEPQSHAGRHEV